MKPSPGGLALPKNAAGSAISPTSQAHGAKTPQFDSALAAQHTIDEEMWR